MAALDEVAILSTWAPADEATSGRLFREGVAKHWGGFRFVGEDEILMDAAVRAFREREADEHTSNRADLHRGVLKWSWKVFALTAPPIPEDGWLVWIDGDVEFLATPTPDFLRSAMPEWADVAFLGRPWAYASETGFMAYHVRRPKVCDLLAKMRETYLGGKFRQLAEWGDAGVFDACRQGMGLREHDLSEHCPEGDLHVWPQTILGAFMRHNKGPQRKRDAYGCAESGHIR